MHSYLLFAVLFAVVLGVFSKPEVEAAEGLKETQQKSGEITESDKRTWNRRRCYYHQHCGPGYYCGRYHYCIPYRRCSHDSHCGYNWHCDSTDWVCKPNSRPQCYKYRDCPNGQLCHNYQCKIWYCRQYRCPWWPEWGRFCYQGQCMYRECTHDRQCKAGHYCVPQGICRPRPTPQPTQPPTTEEPGSGIGEAEL